MESGLAELRKEPREGEISLWTQKEGFFVPGPGKPRLRLKQLEASLSNPQLLTQTPLDTLMVAIPDTVALDSSGIEAGSLLNQINFVFLNQLLEGVVLRLRDLDTIERITQMILQQA